MIGIVNEIIADYKRNGNHLEKLWIMTVYRFGHHFYYIKAPNIIKMPILLLMEIIRKISVVLLFKVEMPFKCHIGGGLRLMHPHGIIIHSNVKIGSNCTLFHQTTIGSNENSKNPHSVATIGNNVYIGCGAKIIGNVAIGDYSKIGANAVVVKSVPEKSVVYCQQITKVNPEL